MRALVVDDEAPARRRLIRMLERLGGVEIVGEAGDGVEALTALTRVDPDVIFLDVQMPALDGLALARSAHLPAIVFVTAYDEHALAAFEVGAADYLLKPVTKARLAAAVERVRARLPSEHRSDSTESQATLARIVGRSAHEPQSRVGVREGKRVQLFDVSEIGRFYSADKYTAFVQGGREQLLDDSLAELELRLSAQGFVRVHRSELVNLAWVVAVESEDGQHAVELRDGTRVGVSRRMVAELRHRLGI